MESFKQVSINKLANIYFDGKVTSRTITFDSGEVKTLGIMQVGEYQFGTDKKELMEIQSGKVEVKLPDSENWIIVSKDQSFEVPAKSDFGIKVLETADYCCSYLDE